VSKHFGAQLAHSRSTVRQVARLLEREGLLVRQARTSTAGISALAQNPDSYPKRCKPRTSKPSTWMARMSLQSAWFCGSKSFERPHRCAWSTLILALRALQRKIGRLKTGASFCRCQQAGTRSAAGDLRHAQRPVYSADISNQHGFCYATGGNYSLQERHRSASQIRTRLGARQSSLNSRRSWKAMFDLALSHRPDICEVFGKDELWQSHMRTDENLEQN